jgi:hypothetical protein
MTQAPARQRVTACLRRRRPLRLRQRACARRAVVRRARRRAPVRGAAAAAAWHGTRGASAVPHVPPCRPAGAQRLPPARARQQRGRWPPGTASCWLRKRARDWRLAIRCDWTTGGQPRHLRCAALPPRAPPVPPLCTATAAARARCAARLLCRATLRGAALLLRRAALGTLPSARSMDAAPSGADNAAPYTVAVVGAGGVGAYFAGRLAVLPGVVVHCIARGAHCEAIRAWGIRLTSIAGDAAVRKRHALCVVPLRRTHALSVLVSTGARRERHARPGRGWCGRLGHRGAQSLATARPRPATTGTRCARCTHAPACATRARSCDSGARRRRAQPRATQQQHLR